MRIERVAHFAEIVDGQPQPHEVEPAVAFEGELSAPFGGQLAAELRQAFHLVGRQFVEPGPRAGLVEPLQRVAQAAARFSQRLGVHQHHVGVAQVREIVAHLRRVGRVVGVVPFGHGVEVARNLGVGADQRQAVVLLAVVDRLEFGRRVADVGQYLRVGAVPVTVAVVVGLVVVEREDDLPVHFVTHVENLFRRRFQSVGGVLHRLFEGRLGLGGLAEREVDLRQQRVGRDVRHAGLFRTRCRRQQPGRFGEVFGQQRVHLLLRAAGNEFGGRRGCHGAGDGHHAEDPVEVEIPPRPQEQAFAAVFVVVGDLGSGHVVEHVVAAVDAVVPRIPDVAQDAVAGRLGEVVDVVAVLCRHSHRFEDVLVAAVADLRQVEAHLRFELGIARHDSLVEVVVGLVEVAFGDVVARVLFEETFAARAQTQYEESQRKEIFRFHSHRHF